MQIYTRNIVIKFNKIRGKNYQITDVRKVKKTLPRFDDWIIRPVKYQRETEGSLILINNSYARNLAELRMKLCSQQ